ncbi:hypothetical protein BB561_003267 [Smittium simulii]|uniref:Uncharacterized protein n=1 Tax=Smittium simulii TaxID=133385 RepID=A0A2T9YMF4_9FUNG|nr:hypothetical protein BB561_003267 [Smittium simulii]
MLCLKKNYYPGASIYKVSSIGKKKNIEASVSLNLGDKIAEIFETQEKLDKAAAKAKPKPKTPLEIRAASLKKAKAQSLSSNKPTLSRTSDINTNPECSQTSDISTDPDSGINNPNGKELHNKESEIKSQSQLINNSSENLATLDSTITTRNSTTETTNLSAANSSLDTTPPSTRITANPLIIAPTKVDSLYTQTNISTSKEISVNTANNPIDFNHKNKNQSASADSTLPKNSTKLKNSKKDITPNIKNLKKEQNINHIDSKPAIKAVDKKQLVKKRNQGLQALLNKKKKETQNTNDSNSPGKYSLTDFLNTL